MDIGEVSKRSGLACSTLRYYEQKGLISSIGRSGLRRQYASNILQRLGLINLGRSAGFSLDEIKNIFTKDGITINRNELKAKADELDEQIKQLQTIREGLLHVARCPAEHHMDCPKFRKMLKAASRGMIKAQ